MTKVGLALSRMEIDAPAAEHFGKARWLLVFESPERFIFLRNTELDGQSVVEAFAWRGCTDVVARRMGPGAYASATAAGMKVWTVGAGVTGRAAVKRLAAGELRPLAPSGRDHRGPHPRAR
jgi:predicted Fe-Mo cluster-binding NifX family protein